MGFGVRNGVHLLVLITVKTRRFNMAHIYRATQIRDKNFGGKVLTYTPKVQPSEYKRAIKVHDRLKSILSQQQQTAIPKAEVCRVISMLTGASSVIQQEFLANYALTSQKFEADPTKYIELRSILIEFYDNIEVGVSEERKKRIRSDLELFNTFFDIHNYTNCSHISYDTGSQYIKWRRYYRRAAGTQRKDNVPMSNSMKPIKSETIGDELNLLTDFNKFGYKREYFKKWDFFEDLKIPQDEANEDDVTALNIEEQRDNFEWLRKNGYAWAHDVALFISVSGCRGQDVQALTKESFSLAHNCLQFHEITFGDRKGKQKTVSAQRVVPLCPTLVELFHRGHIFDKRSGEYADILSNYLARKYREKNPPKNRTHTHMYRHNFACNHLRAGKVSMIALAKRMGHSKSAFTENFYARYENRVLNLERRQEEYQNFIHEIEETYFETYSESIP